MRGKGCQTCQIHFLESHNPSWTQILCQPAQRHSWRVQMHQDEPANDGIKFGIYLQTFDVAFQESHIRQSGLMNPRSCSVENRGIDLHPDDGPTWTNQGSDE